MKNFLLIFCLIILNACSVAESKDYTPVDGVIVYYGNVYAFTYGTEIKVGATTWTRSEEITTGTYIYTSTVSATTDDDTTEDEYQDDGGHYEVISDNMTFYRKVEGMSLGVALYPVATSYDSAKNSTSYQLYTYDITEEPYDYYISDEDTKNESNGYSPLSYIQ